MFPTKICDIIWTFFFLYFQKFFNLNPRKKGCTNPSWVRKKNISLMAWRESLGERRIDRIENIPNPCHIFVPNAPFLPKNEQRWVHLQSHRKNEKFRSSVFECFFLNFLQKRTEKGVQRHAKPKRGVRMDCVVLIKTDKCYWQLRFWFEKNKKNATTIQTK